MFDGAHKTNVSSALLIHMGDESDVGALSMEGDWSLSWFLENTLALLGEKLLDFAGYMA